MAKKKYEESNIQAIATAIREKTGTEQTYYTKDMASGVNEVYEAGYSKAEVDFWNKFTNYGNRQTYKSAFSQAGFTYIRPTRIIKPRGSEASAQTMFQNNQTVKKIEKPYFDLSGVDLKTNFASPEYGHYYTFYGCTELEEIEDIGMQAPGWYSKTYRGCPKLHTIEILRSSELTVFDYAFTDDISLKNVRVDGVIAYSLSFSSAPLTVESMKSVITHLKNYAGTDKEFTCVLALSSACKTALEAEGTTSPNGNLWTDYIDDLGWNLK